jgi:hypothetical protein
MGKAVAAAADEGETVTSKGLAAADGSLVRKSNWPSSSGLGEPAAFKSKGRAETAAAALRGASGSGSAGTKNDEGDTSNVGVGVGEERTSAKEGGGDAVDVGEKGEAVGEKGEAVGEKGEAVGWANSKKDEAGWGAGDVRTKLRLRCAKNLLLFLSELVLPLADELSPSLGDAEAAGVVKLAALLPLRLPGNACIRREG